MCQARSNHKLGLNQAGPYTNKHRSDNAEEEPFQRISKKKGGRSAALSRALHASFFVFRLLWEPNSDTFRDGDSAVRSFSVKSEPFGSDGLTQPHVSTSECFFSQEEPRVVFYAKNVTRDFPRGIYRIQVKALNLDNGEVVRSGSGIGPPMLASPFSLSTRTRVETRVSRSLGVSGSTLFFLFQDAPCSACTSASMSTRVGHHPARRYQSPKSGSTTSKHPLIAATHHLSLSDRTIQGKAPLDFEWTPCQQRGTCEPLIMDVANTIDRTFSTLQPRTSTLYIDERIHP